MSREEFLDDVYDFGGVYSGVYTDPDRHEDVSAAMAWNYSPWPHIEDPELNRLGYGYVSSTSPFNHQSRIYSVFHFYIATLSTTF